MSDLRLALRGLAQAPGFSAVALGLLGALAATRVLDGLLFEVTAHDPATLAAASVLLLATALLACAFPAQRPSRVDPVRALRCE